MTAQLVAMIVQHYPAVGSDNTCVRERVGTLVEDSATQTCLAPTAGKQEWMAEDAVVGGEVFAVAVEAAIE